MARANVEELVEAIVSRTGGEVVVIVVNSSSSDGETARQTPEAEMNEYPHESDQSDIDYEKDFFLQAFLEAIFGRKKEVTGGGGESSIDAILQGSSTP